MVFYLVVWVDEILGFKPTEIPSNEAKEKYPVLVFQFLEQILVFKMPILIGETNETCDGAYGENHDSREDDNVSGKPLKVWCKYYD